MTPQEREQFRSLTRRQERLEEALLQLREDLREMERRSEASATSYAPAVETVLPPVVIQLPVMPPPFQVKHEVPTQPTEPEASIVPANLNYLTPLAPVTESSQPEPAPETVPTPAAIESQSAPELPPVPEFQQATVVPDPIPIEEKPGLEFQFGRWLARIGVVFALITLVSFSTLAYKHFYHFMGPWSKLAVLAFVSSGMVLGGLRLERGNAQVGIFGRTLAGGGLACLYYTIYGATYVEQLQVITSPLFGGCLLLAWSGGVLWLAERKKSELLSVFAIALAYFSSAITPVGEFTMVANLILSLTAVIFLIRNAWTGLSYLCLVGTYVGLLRQFVVYDSNSHLWFEIVHGIAFWPAAAYLAGAWVIYTAGVFLANTPSFAAGKRMAFLCLNNGGFVGLLTVASSLSGYGHIGAILCYTGVLFMVTASLVGRVRQDASELSAAYLIQGLALATGGLVIAYSGVTRGLLIIVESVFLAAAVAFARNPIMKAAAQVSSLLGTLFLLGEINPAAAHPWVLIIGGSAAMLANAWLARRDFWGEPRETAAQRFVLSSAYYVLLATALLGRGIFHSPLEQDMAITVMAGVALVLTFSVYLVPLFELPLLIQLLLLLSLGGAALPLNDSHPWWSELIVGSVTMILVTWWPRQKIVRTDHWLQPMMIVYSLAMVAVTACGVHPHVGAQGWIISASLLSLGFLFYGIYARNWPFAVAGQLLLVDSIYHYLFPDQGGFPWTWWASAVPIAVTFFTTWLVQERLRKTESLDESARGLLRLAISAYQILTLILIVRLIYGLVPEAYVPLSFFAFAATLMGWNLKWPSSMGIRCAMALDIFGTFAYFSQNSLHHHGGATWVNGLGFLLFLGQSAVLRRWGATLVTALEISGLTLVSSLVIGNYVYWTVHPHVSPQSWMIIACAVSVLFLAYSVWTRTWQFALSSQIYLGLAVWQFFNPPGQFASFDWAWWAATILPAIVFFTGWFLRQQLPRFTNLPESTRSWLDTMGYVYQAVALGLAIRWIYGIIPADEITFALFVFATGLMIWNLRWPSPVGLRAALLVDVIGAANYLSQPHAWIHPFVWSDPAAFALFLAQPALLRHWGRELLSGMESWAVIIGSAAMAWICVGNSIEAAGSNNQTLGWAVYALVLTLAGFAANERRQRWCGLLVLLAAIVRVGLYDFWTFSDLYKVLTFFVLTIICLGLSFLYYKFADRLKQWL